MYLTGDYVNLVDYDGPYLDKPHLHFWLSALSYHLFGVTGFAYKFPSFVLSLVGILAVYRLGVLLVNRSTGLYGALIYATSASFLLALNDVRMDAILTASIAISLWQIAGYFVTSNNKYVFGASLGLAMGFCTKGHIGVLIPLLFTLAYAQYSKKWHRVFSWKLLLAVILFFVYISPVVYCYYLQFNLHPETVVRGRGNIDGVRFILWDQSLGRYGGEMGADSKQDKFFFIHTFLWVFAPWSLLALASLIRRRSAYRWSAAIKSVFIVLIVFGLLVGFSSFKLPHYLNVILPLAALWVGEFASHNQNTFTDAASWVERMMWLLIGLLAALILVWWFPDQPLVFWIGLTLYFIALFYIIRKRSAKKSFDFILRLSAAVLVVFWLLNVAFYPALLKFQGGNVLALKESVYKKRKDIFSLKGFYSSSFYFYTGELRREVSVDAVAEGVNYVLMDEKQVGDFKKINRGWRVVDSALDYEITKVDLAFLNPEKRMRETTKIVLLSKE